MPDYYNEGLPYEVEEIVSGMLHQIEEAVIRSADEEALDAQLSRMEKELQKIETEMDSLRDEEERRKRLEDRLKSEKPARLILAASDTVYAIKRYILYKKPQCGLCSPRREIKASAPNGDSIMIPCSCSGDTEHAFMLIPRTAFVSEGREIFELTQKPDAWHDGEYKVFQAGCLDTTEKDAEKDWNTPLFFSSEDKARRYAFSVHLGRELDSQPPADMVSASTMVC